MTKKALLEVVEMLGSQARLAELLEVTQPTVSNWVNRIHGKISAENAVKLEEMSGGEVPRWVSRPDLWSAPRKKRAR